MCGQCFFNIRKTTLFRFLLIFIFRLICLNKKNKKIVFIAFISKYGNCICFYRGQSPTIPMKVDMEGCL